jgi:hypothetical protein
MQGFGLLRDLRSHQSLRLLKTTPLLPAMYNKRVFHQHTADLRCPLMNLASLLFF